MKLPRIANAVGQIDDELITAAEKTVKNRKKLWITVGSLAACLVLICSLPFVYLAFYGAGSADQTGNDPQKGVTLIAQEIGTVWPWEYKTIEEKYVKIDVDGQDYIGRKRAVGPALVGEKIGTYTATGYEETADGVHHQDFEVFEILGVSSKYAVAVLMENSYYVFFTECYDPPATLGEILEQCSLPETVELSRFSVNRQDAQEQYFILHSDKYIWSVLEECADAPFADPEEWWAHERNYLSFTVTSEALGVYKRVLYVTEDGYLWTNIFDGAYLYDIGTEAAESIIRYATENADAAEYEPYQNTVAGTVTQITDDYILIDDSILCSDPQQGRTYKVLLGSKRVSRYVELALVSVGDVIVVSYEGTIDAENTLSEALNIQKGILAGTDLLIPE